jgi:cytochrome c1
MFAVVVVSLGLGACSSEEASAVRQINADATRGRMLVARIGCNVCHVVPGVPGPRGRVGPSLERFATRALIAGVVPNRADLLVQFVRDAPSLNPGTAMPELPLDEGEARDVAAFLYTLR